MNMTEALMATLRAEPSRYRVAELVGVDQGVLSRFLRGQRSLTLATADRIVKGLGLECRLVRRRSRKAGDV
jgi:plasmid maintenance system antidote protein VapI